MCVCVCVMCVSRSCLAQTSSTCHERDNDTHTNTNTHTNTHTHTHTNGNDLAIDASPSPSPSPASPSPMPKHERGAASPPPHAVNPHARAICSLLLHVQTETNRHERDGTHVLRDRRRERANGSRLLLLPLPPSRLPTYRGRTSNPHSPHIITYRPPDSYLN